MPKFVFTKHNPLATLKQLWSLSMAIKSHLLFLAHIMIFIIFFSPFSGKPWDHRPRWTGFVKIFDQSMNQSIDQTFQGNYVGQSNDGSPFSILKATLETKKVQNEDHNIDLASPSANSVCSVNFFFSQGIMIKRDCVENKPLLLRHRLPLFAIIFLDWATLKEN